jgi:hypothetical protein
MMAVSTRLLTLGAGVWLAANLAGATALADTRTLHGSNLALTLTGDEDTTIETDPSLSHTVRVVADSVDCLAAPEGGGQESGGEVRISTAACADTGQLTVMVPPSFPVAVIIAGSGNVRIGDLQGPLTATVSSDGDLSVRHAAMLQLAIRGSGDTSVQTVDGPADIKVDGSGTVKLQRLNGPLQYAQHGSGDLVIAHIEAPAAKFDSAGSGDTVVAGGHIAFLQVRTNGSGDFAMGGTVDSADLQASGGADIKVPHVSGQVQRHASGGSTIVVGGGGNIGAAAEKLAAAAMNADDDHDSDLNITIGHGHGGFGHFIAGILVLGVIVFVWRTLSRNGGLAGLRARFATTGGPPAAPSHPGVVALCDLIAGLERRLARVETHVTSREFELNQKFRDIEAGGSGP